MASRRKGWDLLSDVYRDRLRRGGITESMYTSGMPLHGARGHVSANIESFQKQTTKFARTYDNGRSELQVRSWIRYQGVTDGRAYMKYIHKMTRLYESGDTEAARQMWLNRNPSWPDYMAFYHGVFNV